MIPLLSPKSILPFLFGLAFLVACAPAAVTAPAETLPPAAVPQTGATSASQTFADPFAYCAGVGTIDQPDARYTGPKLPDAVVNGLIKASGAAADTPVDVFRQGTFWRCMDKQVYACFVGANLPCESKANTSQEPTAAMNDFCKANPGADTIPAAVTGHETIYAWACKDSQAVAGKQVFQVDSQGYIREIWYAIPIAPP